MNAQSWVTTPPGFEVEAVTSFERPEILDGIAFTSEIPASATLRPGFGPRLAETPARETCRRTAMQSCLGLRPSAPSLSGFPGTGAILF